MKHIGLVKQSGILDTLSRGAAAVGKFGRTSAGAGVNTLLTWGSRAAKMGVGLTLSSMILKQLIDNIKNDSNKKRIIEDLALNDPVIKEINKKTLLEWYATICFYAPNISSDKQTVAEVLKNFARFGKIDMSTLKMLADVEKSLAAVKDKQPAFTDLIKLV